MRKPNISNRINKNMGLLQKISFNILCFWIVALVHLPVTHSQAGFFGDSQPTFFYLNDFRQYNLLNNTNIPKDISQHIGFLNNFILSQPQSSNPPTPPEINLDHHKSGDQSSEEDNQSVEDNRFFEKDILEEDNSTKIIFIRKSLNDNPNEFSKTAMDVITIVWYVATFLALAAFFMLMACSDRRCNDAQRNNGGNNVRPAEAPVSPPTPSPSYSEFAPPSYESVIKMEQEAIANIFVIPFSSGLEDTNKDSSNATPTAPSPTQLTHPPVTFYTVNELQKLGS